MQRQFCPQCGRYRFLIDRWSDWRKASKTILRLVNHGHDIERVACDDCVSERRDVDAEDTPKIERTEP